MFYGQDITEAVSTLDIYNQTQVVIYSVLVEHISQNDIVHLTSQFEATNPYAYNVMIGSLVILADNNTATTGVVLDTATSFNITQNMHHGVVIKTRNWQAPQDYDHKYVNVIGYAASDISSPGDLLIIEQNYGHLDVVIASNHP